MKFVWTVLYYRGTFTLACPGVVELIVWTVKYIATGTLAGTFIKEHVRITDWDMWADASAELVVEYLWKGRALCTAWALTLTCCGVENLSREETLWRCMWAGDLRALSSLKI